MFSPDQVPTQVENILHRSMLSHEALGLPHRLETTHPSLSNPGRLVRLFSPVILILPSTVDRFRHHFPVSDRIAPQLVSHDLPGFDTMRTQ